MLPDLSTTYIFKFEKIPLKEVEDLMLKTVNFFEFYIPKENSEIAYVVGALYSKEEVDNFKMELEKQKKVLYKATIAELNSAQSLVGFEYYYIKNVYRGEMP